MRILILSAGTGSFHCGTCMRDNALARALRRLGHDAVLAPMYLPMVLDEPSAAGNTPLFYGGINVFLQQISALFRRTPRWMDRLLDSPVLLRLAGARAGMTSPRKLADLTLSMLRGEEGRQAKELERLARWARDERPDVVCLSNALLLGLVRRLRQETGAAMVCTLQGEDTFLDSLPEPARFECWRLVGERARDCSGLLAVSRYHADLIAARAGMDRAAIAVVPNGIDLEGYAPAPAPPDPPVIGYLARLSAAKGIGALVEAFITLRRGGRVPGVRLHAAGSMTPADEAFVAGLRRRVEAEGLRDSVRIRPNVTRQEKIAFLRGLTVFSVPATYGESFGLYVLEALAAGVPVVQPAHAAFPELIQATGGGLLYDPARPEALAESLESLLLDPARARALGEAGRQAVHARFTVDAMARGVLGVFGSALASSRAARPGR